jgi:PKD repeat protein
MANVFVDRIASTDLGYKTGDLSIYPVAKDDSQQLFVVANNAITTTSQSASYGSPYFLVESTEGFPAQGIICVGTESVYYDQKTDNSFRRLKRGFAGSRQDQWPIGTPVAAVVSAEPHNAVKDALINIETNLGVDVDPAPASLNGLLKALETRFLAPRPVFQAGPRYGSAPLEVKFQNFSSGDILRYFWDFGDGGTSIEAAPTHTYQSNGVYTVQLNVITKLGAQGYATKTDYITVSDYYKPAFFYYEPSAGTVSTVFTFTDQTDGQITSRYWQWDDGNATSVLDPDIHTATHTYTTKGTYNPSVLVLFADGTKKIVRTVDPLVVS